jgi:hypothetical protein
MQPFHLIRNRFTNKKALLTTPRHDASSILSLSRPQAWPPPTFVTKPGEMGEKINKDMWKSRVKKEQREEESGLRELKIRVWSGLEEVKELAERWGSIKLGRVIKKVKEELKE